MMERLERKGAALASDRQQATMSEVASRLRGLLGDGAVEIEEARVLVRGRGIIKRWLIDPELRFLGGGMK